MDKKKQIGEIADEVDKKIIQTIHLILVSISEMTSMSEHLLNDAR